MNKSRLLGVVAQLFIFLAASLSSQIVTAVGNPDYSGCVPTPLPTTPVEPSVEITWERSSGDAINVVAWRIPCNDSDSAVLLRVTPISDAPFVCSPNFEPVIQDAIQYNSTKLVQAPDGSSFCDDLLVPTTFLLEQWSFEANFNDDADFALHNAHDDFGAGPLNITAYDPAVYGPVDLTGGVQDATGTDLCSMVLASGQFMFTCNPNGPFSLLDLPRENNGTVKRQIYVDGFFPDIDVVTRSVNETVVMTRSGTCPDYNSFPEPGVFPSSAGNRIDISGTILLQNTQTPLCAMALANGQFAFTCDGTGSYSLNIPLDNNGQYKLQVYAQGFAPLTQRFDEFSANNDVRMARAAECQ